MNKNIYIYNSIEDEWDFISSFKKDEQKKLIHDSNRFADCYLFANAFLPSFTLISPISINPEVVSYFESLSGCKTQILVPKQKTHFTCDNIFLDKHVFSTLVTDAKKAGRLVMYVYAMTPHVFELKRQFEKAGVRVSIPEGMKEENLWTVKHFGTKSGFRKSFASLMPPGIIEPDPKKVIASAVSLFKTSPGGIVFKTDKGNAGQGVHILKKTRIKSKEKLIIELKKIYHKEPYLKKHPVVLEAYINTRKERTCPFPSIECFIHQDGRIEFPYYCNMIVTTSGEFYGMEMHKSVFPKKIKKTILSLSQKLANTYRDAGYRGRFDIDMVYDGKKVYPDESNTRINGGTDTYLIVKKLVGSDVFSKRYVLSSYANLPSKVLPSFGKVKQLFERYLFDKKKKVGLIINSESVIKNGGFSYILVGETKQKTLSLRRQVNIMLKNIKNS